ADGLELSSRRAAAQPRPSVRHVCADLRWLATGIDFAVVWEALKTVRGSGCGSSVPASSWWLASPRCAKSWNRPACLCVESVQAAESGLSASAGASEVTPLIT
uniref:Integron gene cassette protein n=1 Tax=Macrostomum lignano TaxID=282301 RepID=A0A1I8F4C8_9PLAT